MQKVLVVDDDTHIRDVVCFALRREGFEAVEAWTGRGAVEKFEAEQPDLIVLDVLMPEGDGIAVC
ncbi:MAG: response regulator, partial [Pseudomonadota bacterium]|nr:response regulator [Pseudomonadota bacterium]